MAETNNVADITDRRALIESKIDKAGTAQIDIAAGGVDLKNVAQALEIAKVMAISGPCVPLYLRENPGSCLYHVMRAARWRMDPFAVAEDSYVVENRRTQEVRIAYGSRTIHAVVERNAPLKTRLRATYEGEGDARTCTVEGTFLDGETRSYTTPTLGTRRAKARNPDAEGKGGRGSPLWWDDPDQQLFYFASRSWARRWCPDVLLGAYSREELQEEDFEPRRLIDPRMPAIAQVEADKALASRLDPEAAARAGFNLPAVISEANSAATSAMTGGEPAVEEAQPAKPEKAKRTLRKVKEPEPTVEAPQEPADAPDAPQATTLPVSGPEALLDARKAGGRAFFNGQPFSDGARKYPEGSDLRAAWEEGYNARREAK